MKNQTAQNCYRFSDWSIMKSFIMTHAKIIINKKIIIKMQLDVVVSPPGLK